MSVSLSALVTALQQLAPLHYAEDWDNVGLLVDPRAPGGELNVERVLLTIDTNDAVLAELTELGAHCLIAYHPPIFRAQKRFARERDAVLCAALQQGFAVYSPHTALDSAPLGLNDWLLDAFGPGRRGALTPAEAPNPHAELKFVVFVPPEHADSLRAALSAAGAGQIGNYSQCSFGLLGEGTFHGNDGANPVVGRAGQLERVQELRLELVCARSALPALVAAVRTHHPYEEPAWEAYPLVAAPHPTAGRGRLLELDEPAPLNDLVARCARHLGLPALRVAAHARHAQGAPISRIAVAAGAGGSLLENPGNAELVLTGEMRHHDVLAQRARGRSVILAEHSHTERGYLPTLRARLLQELDAHASLDVRIAAQDADPLELWSSRGQVLF